MAITRILALSNTLALMGTIGLAPSYAAERCCGWVGGKYINLKTGMPVLPPKVAPAGPGPFEAAKPESDDVTIVIGPAPEPKRATNK
jgi:hypothetical protein